MDSNSNRDRIFHAQYDEAYEAAAAELREARQRGNLQSMPKTEEAPPAAVVVPREEPRRPRRRGGFLRHVASALVFTLLGTALGVYGAYNVLPGTRLFEESKLARYIADQRVTLPPATPIITPEIREEGLTIPEIVALVEPAVVTVSVRKQVPGGVFNPGGGFQEGIGTGFILNEEGYVATNYHVVEGGQEVNVVLYTGEEVSARVVNFDAANDLAVLRITEDIRVPGVVKLGDSDRLRVGETVVAIGNPIAREFAGTVTSGIVSALNRMVTVGNQSYNYLQTDAAINGGNSGGPLINTRGEVIGINSAKIASDQIEGIGFAIPINDLKSRMDTLFRAALYVGIAGRDINETTAQARDMPTGVLVLDIQDGSPAFFSAMQVGDVITRFDGVKIASIQELNERKDTKSAGDTVVIQVYRSGEYLEFDLVLEERP